MDGFHGFDNLSGHWQKNTTLTGYGFSQAAFNSNSTLSVINQFKFLAARSVRTSTIILAAFNTVSAFATAAGIFYDCYTTRRRSKLQGQESISIFRCVRGPDTYPFFLSLGITIQGIIFAVCQSFGLDGLFIPGCTLISQFMWPAVFIVPYIQLVLGLEVTIRALRSGPFPPRSKWSIPICLAIVKIIVLATGLVGFFISPPGFCFASLFWFVAKWAEGGFVLLLMVTIILTICGVIIFLKLTRNLTIEDSERINASRMVYYLALAVVTNALIVPFFGYLTFSNPMDDNGSSGLTLSMISAVVANVTGLSTGGLHLFLRSKTIATIGPRNKLAEYERQKAKHQSRVGGTTDMDFNGHMLQPIAGPRSIAKTESQEHLVDEKSDVVERGESVYPGDFQQSSPRYLNPLRSNAVFDERPNMPRVPEPTQVPPTPSSYSHSRKPSASYTLFPSKGQGNTTPITLLPTAYNPNSQSSSTATKLPFSDFNDTLRPPPSFAIRHRRDSSMASSATVQIGLRLSNVADIGPFRGKASAETEAVNALDYPLKEDLPSTYQLNPITTSDSSDIALHQSPSRSKDSRMKNLPSVPAESGEERNECTLSPTVYNPSSPTKTKTPSPRGVGFNPPPRANTSPVLSPPPQPSSRNRGNSSSAANNRSDWI
ncbi:hypothetical protein GGR54DRAFT_72661 [Hypoxylon sp. NC1633]|nr:hypothetical protein GGR54DRAFT_72661 [Hypoxylon sp. NC1633]